MESALARLEKAEVTPENLLMLKPVEAAQCILEELGFDI